MEGLVPFWWGQLKTIIVRLWKMAGLFFQLEEVWLRSKPKSEMEEALQELLEKTKQGIVDWRDLKAKELVQVYARLHDSMPQVRIPSVVSLWVRKRNPFVRGNSRHYAQNIWHRWYRHAWNPLKWVEVWLFEWVNGLRFFFQLFVAPR